MSQITITVEPIENGFLVTFGQHWQVAPGRPGSPQRFFAANHAGVLGLIGQRLQGASEGDAA